jgi:hypothetical protein
VRSRRAQAPRIGQLAVNYTFDSMAWNITRRKLFRWTASGAPALPLIGAAQTGQRSGAKQGVPADTLPGSELNRETKGGIRRRARRRLGGLRWHDCALYKIWACGIVIVVHSRRLPLNG